MTGRILVALDGSKSAERVLPLAFGLVRATGRGLMLVRAVPPFDPRPYLTAETAMLAEEEHRLTSREASTYLGQLADRLRADGLHTDARLEIGQPALAIAHVAHDSEVDLIVLSTHKDGGGDWLLDSVVDGVLRHVSAPVLLVPAWAQAIWPRNRRARVLVPLDGSELADRAVEAVIRIDVGRLPELLLLGVSHTGDALAQTLEEHLVTVAAAMRARGIEVATCMRDGHPAEAITQEAVQRHVHLIAMGTHGRSGLARLALGSVARETVRKTPVPVLLVRR
jgi:nucleotide-binding universal stress UspA family protein